MQHVSMLYIIVHSTLILLDGGKRIPLMNHNCKQRRKIRGTRMHRTNNINPTPTTLASHYLTTTTTTTSSAEQKKIVSKLC